MIDVGHLVRVSSRVKLRHFVSFWFLYLMVIVQEKTAVLNFIVARFFI